MRRLFWFSMGAAVGSTITFKTCQAMYKVAPRRVASQSVEKLETAKDAVTSFLADFTGSMEECEAQLRVKHGLKSDV